MANIFQLGAKDFLLQNVIEFFGCRQLAQKFGSDI